MLQIDRAGFWYDLSEPPIVFECNLAIRESEFVAVVGESGSGKTTLLRLAAGLLQTAQRSGRGDTGYIRGAVRYEDAVLERPHRAFGYVPQNFTASLVPSLSAMANVLLPVRSHGISKRERDLATRLMAKAGIGAVSEEQIGRLSGGQKQRVAICRALIGEPRIVFMDEPFANLDPGLRPEIGELLLDLRKDRFERADAGEEGLRPLALMVVTHDVSGVCRFADRVLGVRRQYGRPEYREWTSPLSAGEIEAWIAL